MPKLLNVGVSQSRTQSDTPATLRSLESITRDARARGVDILLFPEAYLGGYPRTCNFGCSIGARTPDGREQFLRYYQGAVDLGDTPGGAGDAWVGKALPVAVGQKYRGDGTREELERVARETGVFLAVGAIERAAGSLYCAVVYVCPRLGAIGKRRKVMPTGTERLVWAQGQPSSLRAVVTEIKGVRVCLAAAICWENFMPLLRQSLYMQNVNLYLAPTADPRDSWASLMRTIALEGRCFVMSANQCIRRRNLPDWIVNSGGDSSTTLNKSVSIPLQHSVTLRRRESVVSKTEEGHEINWPKSPELNGAASAAASPAVEESLELGRPVSSGQSRQTMEDPNEFLSRGGSCIVSPTGDVIAGPLWEVEDGGLLTVEVDMEDCERGRLDLDVAGSYSRSDAFKMTVEGLDLIPPP